MLFNSTVFIFLFLPPVMGLAWWLARRSPVAYFGFLFIASCVFYSWWRFDWIFVLLASITVNYALGSLLFVSSKARKRVLLIVGVAFNLLLLGYFKYIDFAIGTINDIADSSILGLAVALPIGISFFTFQQIAYLVDISRGLERDRNFLRYAVFVSFFPQLIAGPIVHHAEMMPQFRRPRVTLSDVEIGLTFFAAGLFKKIVIADSVAPYADPVFLAAVQGSGVSMIEAWFGALAYTFQLYFDFSAYSDMAVGIARLFGIRLPENFRSPYKALNIIEFWRRWHITLSRFLRDYLYFALGGNRKGEVRRWVNLMMTMLLGGLWHGAGWTFVLWGGLHGLYLVINHAWRHFTRHWEKSNVAWRIFGHLLTFTAVVAGWVVFRATDLDSAAYMLGVMFGADGFGLTQGAIAALGYLGDALVSAGVVHVDPTALALTTGINEALLLLLLLATVWFAPTMQELLANRNPLIASQTLPPLECPRLMRWAHPALVGAAVAVCLLVSIGSISEDSPFLYFQF